MPAFLLDNELAADRHVTGALALTRDRGLLAVRCLVARDVLLGLALSGAAGRAATELRAV